MSQVVLKSVKNSKNNILWQALYIDSIKMLENYVIDINKAKKAFNIEDDIIINIIVHENNKQKIPELFPNIDLFKHLNINEEYELSVGDFVWIPNYNKYNTEIKSGKVTVKKIFNTPINSIIWDTDYVKKTATWFSCKEVKGIFCWTKLVQMQDRLKDKIGDRYAIIISNN